MTTAYFDCFNGISGDMTLGALLDLGADFEELRAALATLPVSDYTIEAAKVKRAGIAATRVTVECSGKQPHRHLHHIEAIIGESGFSAAVKDRALAAFRRLAEAEAEVHQTTVQKVHFHEVGAVDAIVDIVGAMWLLERLGVREVIASNVVVGSGTVQCAHGEMPVPAPATALLLKGVPIETGPLSGEMTTPTGAAILTTVATRFGPLDGFRLHAAGYGAGGREYPKHPNCLRVLLGEAGGMLEGLPLERRSLTVLSTEIDDMPAEWTGYTLERLFAAGCLDAYVTPIQMKKGRPGVSLSVLAPPEKAAALVDILLKETTTFGVKVSQVERYCLHRRIETVETPLGSVRVKVGLWDDAPLKASPEYEDCKRIAAERGVPLTEVYAAAHAAARAAGLGPEGGVW